VVIDIDPNFRRPNSRERGSEPVLNCRIERDGNIDNFRGRRWLGQQFRARKKGILLQHSIFIPHANFFSELLKRKREGKLTAKRISVRPDVTQDREALVLAQYPADFLEF
jgi:hypothetical protein